MVSGPQAVRYRGSGCTPRRPSRWATGSKRQHTCWPPATATPALAFPHGAAPEIIDHGRTGYLCRGEDEMTAAVARLHQISRRHCRAAAEQRFSLARMAADYDRLYRAILERPGRAAPERTATGAQGECRGTRQGASCHGSAGETGPEPSSRAKLAAAIGTRRRPFGFFWYRTTRSAPLGPAGWTRRPAP